MTTVSYPAVGTGGFSESKWAEYFGDRWGIVNDFDGTSLAMTPISVGDIARYTLGQVQVGGYMLRITTPTHDITIPTAAGTYYTWACYDPALNVAGGGGAASSAGPVFLGVSTGLPSTSGGKVYVLLDKIVRAASQALTAATISSLRVWAGASLQMKQLPPGFNANAAEWAPDLNEHVYPYGSTMYILDTATTYHRALDTGGFAIWRAGSSGWVTFPTNSPLTAVNSDTAPQYRFESGGVIRMRGALKRSNNTSLTSGADVVLGTMPTGARPPANHAYRFVTMAKPPSGRSVATGDVDPSTGVVTLYGPGSGSLDWVDLSGITYATR